MSCRFKSCLVYISVCGAIGETRAFKGRLRRNTVSSNLTRPNKTFLKIISFPITGISRTGIGTGLNRHIVPSSMEDNSVSINPGAGSAIVGSNPTSPNIYRSVDQLAESTALGAVQCEFESHWSE